MRLDKDDAGPNLYKIVARVASVGHDGATYRTRLGGKNRLHRTRIANG